MNYLCLLIIVLRYFKFVLEMKSKPYRKPLNQEHIVAQPKLAAQLYIVRKFTKTLEGFESSMQKVSEIGYTAVQVSAIGIHSTRRCKTYCR